MAKGAASKIDIGQLVLAGGVGVVDEFLRVKDAQAGRTDPLKRWMDWFRIAATVGGLAAQVWWPKYDRWGEAAALAGMPLVVKSLNDSIKIIQAQGGIGSAPRMMTPRQYIPVSPPAPMPAASRYPAPVNQSEYTNVRLS